MGQIKGFIKGEKGGGIMIKKITGIQIFVTESVCQVKFRYLLITQVTNSIFLLVLQRVTSLLMSEHRDFRLTEIRPSLYKTT